MTRLVLASANEGKLHELRDALEGRAFELVSARDAGVVEFPPEDGDTYEANAMMKAAHVSTLTGLPALGDDSGLEVDALNGAPGIHSARFGGDLADGERNAYLLSRLRDVPDDARTARFVTVLVLALPEGSVRSFTGTCEGRILQGPRGTRGFGYEPVFFHDGLGKTFAQAELSEKREVGHRGRALDAFTTWIDGEGARLLSGADDDT